MIFYFSGTGNSREVAQRLATATGDTACCITHATSYIEEETPSLGFVFPIYAWGLPKVMVRFIRDLQISTLPSYIYMVCTCGDDIGLADLELQRLLQQKQMTLDAAWSVKMPNTYISLPGFDVDPEQLVQQKLEETLAQLDEISQHILRKTRHHKDVCPGKYPWLKSRLIRPFFNSFLTGDKKFKVNDSCTHCGLCAQVCPMSNINYSSDGKPYWNGNCADCLACYHSCPQHAIHYGRYTENKGQYLLRMAIKRLKQ